MNKIRSTKIGDLVFTELGISPKETYSDGDIESKLLELFKSTKPNVARFMADNPGWATTYHLSPERENLLNWYDFAPGSRVLEIGAGCGAITGLLANKCDSVVALELSKRRAEINANRNKNNHNIEVVVGNLEDLASYNSEKFDYVICIGVLEYAGRFINVDNPFEKFIDKLASHTKTDGVLLLAIENKLGLKYLSGAKEDHVRRFMEGIEGYPHYDGIKTFGKNELELLLSDAGYNQVDFFYPFPDYKLPHTTYSDKYMPGTNTPNIPSSFYPTPTPDQPRQQIFREQLAVRTLAQNNLYGEFANSFLISATKKSHIRTNKQPVFARCTTSRRSEYQILTRMYKNGNNYSVEKKALSDTSNPHIHNLIQQSEVLKNSFLSKLAVNKVLSSSINSITFEYINGPSMETRLINQLLDNNQQEFVNTVNQFISLLDSLPSKNCVATSSDGFSYVFGTSLGKTKEPCVINGVLDLNFDNILLSESSNKYVLIDYEWSFPFAIPKSYLISRSLLYFFRRHSQIVRGITSEERPSVEIGESVFVPTFVHNKFAKYFSNLNNVLKSEMAFQEYVLGDSELLKINKETTIIDTELSDNTPDAYQILLSSLGHYRLQESRVEAQQLEISRLQSSLNEITKSKSWRAINKINRARVKLRKPRNH